MQRIRSSNILHMIERSHAGVKKDHPPDYVEVVKMKKEEEEELPTYSEAVEIESKTKHKENVVLGECSVWMDVDNKVS